MLWLVSVILSILCALFNPYVGLFGIFLIVEAIIYLAFEFSAKGRLALAKSPSSSETDIVNRKLYQSGKRLLTIWCAMAVIFFFLCSVVLLGVWALASGILTGNEMVVSPILVFSGENRSMYSLLLLISSIAFNLLTSIFVWSRRNNLLKQYQL